MSMPESHSRPLPRVRHAAPQTAMARTSAIGAAAALALACAGCGQKGALYLPDAQPHPVPASQPTSGAAPAATPEATPNAATAGEQAPVDEATRKPAPK